MKMQFEVPCRVAYGDNLWVVGDAPELGAWNPKAGLALKWTEGDKWIGSIEVHPWDQIQFKVGWALAASPGCLILRPAPQPG